MAAKTDKRMYVVRTKWVAHAAEAKALPKDVADLIQKATVATRPTKVQLELTPKQWESVCKAAKAVADAEDTPGGIRQSANATVKRGHEATLLTGKTSRKQTSPKAEQADPPVAAVAEGPSTVAEYRGALEALGVEVPAKAKKADLVALYETAHAA